MLVDEVLAVGDLGFQSVLTVFQRYVSQGGFSCLYRTTCISSSPSANVLWCSMAERLFDGPTAGAIERYARLNESSKVNGSAATSTDPTEANPVDH
jgi:hypothetical protein